MSSEKNAIPTVMRAYVLLEKIVDSQRPIAASDLIHDIGLPKPTVHRLLQQLEEEGLIQREPVSKRYMPGNRAQTLAFNIASHNALGAPRHAILQALSNEIGETCNCTMLDGNEIIYFDRVETNWPFRIQLPVGSRLPLHCTASGKLFLAYMNPAQRKRLITAAQLLRHTEKTITDPDKLLKDLKKVEETGVGVDSEENVAGMVALAVPVLNGDNKICFTIAVHAPKIRKPLEELQQYIPSMRRAAAAMAANYCEAMEND